MRFWSDIISDSSGKCRALPGVSNASEAVPSYLIWIPFTAASFGFGATSVVSLRSMYLCSYSTCASPITYHSSTTLPASGGYASGFFDHSLREWCDE